MRGREPAGTQEHGERSGGDRGGDRDGLPRRSPAHAQPHHQRHGQGPEGEEQVEPVEHRRMARVEVHEQGVDAGIDDARPHAHHQEPQQEQRPVPRGGDEQQAHGDQSGPGRQQQPAWEPAGENAHRHGARHVHDGIDEVREAHAPVRLVERSLDLADERRDEEDGPAQQEERREAGEDDIPARRRRLGGRGGGVLGHGAPGWRRRSRGLRLEGRGGGRYWTRTSDLTDVNRAL